MGRRRRPGARPRPSVPTSPFCVRGGRARVTGIGEVVEPLPPVDADVHAAASRRSAARPPRCTGRGTGSADPPPTGRTTSSRPRWRSSRGWPSGATAWPGATGRRPRLAGSGSTWFVEGAFPGDGRIVVRTTPPALCADRPPGDGGRSGASAGIGRAASVRSRYLPARRCQRVRFSIFLCFFLRIRLRRFLISEPMRRPT